MRSSRPGPTAHVRRAERGIAQLGTLSRNMGDEFVFEFVDWQPVLFGNKDFAQLMKKWNLDEFVTLKR
jgi:hypothetical protein